MRYEVEKLETGEYEITHIEKREMLDGTEVEVLRGKNKVTLEKVEEAIKNYTELLEQHKANLSDEKVAELVAEYKEKVEGDVYITEQHLEDLHKMLEAIGGEK